ncbi:MAG: SDR family oxidoreductase [Methylococcaceae bacterium]
MIKKYFVTGATGAIGSALIPLLLEDYNCQVWALLRADSADHLTKRLEELITFWEMDRDQAQDARQRIIPLLGDTDRSKFALSDETYAEIASQCTHIIHCAGVVRMNLPLEVARQHALGSTQSIVELALACQTAGSLQKIDYVSTVGVAGRMSGIVPETWITQPREFHNTYEQSKAEAEDYLRTQIEQHNLPVTVHRPSMVVGDSKTGRIIHHQIFYYLCELISGRKTFGILPRLADSTLDIVPVDYVTQVIKWSADQGKNCVGQIFHLCSGSGRAIPLTKLQRLVRDAMKNQGVKLPIVISVPTGFFVLLLKAIMPLTRGAVLRTLKVCPIFIDYLADSQFFGNNKTLQFLVEQRGPMLVADNAYLNNVLLKYLMLRVINSSN